MLSEGEEGLGVGVALSISHSNGNYATHSCNYRGVTSQSQLLFDHFSLVQNLHMKKKKKPSQDAPKNPTKELKTLV